VSDPSDVSAAPGTAAASRDEAPARIAPRSVVVACILWAIPVLAEIASLVYVGFMVAWAASIGGPAWDLPIFVGAPLGLIAIVLLAIQIPCALALRRGSRGSRNTLLVVGILTGLVAVWFTRPIPGYPLTWVSLVGFVVVAAVVAAIVLTFTPTANRFFRKGFPLAGEARPATTAPTA
jgi:hypothetical protein